MRNLKNALATVTPKWFDIGIQLRIEHHILKEFEQQYTNNPSRCLSEMLQYWLKGNAVDGKSHVNWETIIEALKSRSIGETGLAEEIISDNIQLQHTASERDSQSKSMPSHSQSKSTPGTPLKIHY